jgi:VCBS repeat-containing protein
MKRFLLNSIVFLCWGCQTLVNPFDPDDPNYVYPSFVVDTTRSTISDGDTLKEETLRIVLIGNDEVNLFRWRLDSTNWSDWTGQGVSEHVITLSALDTGWHELHVQTCYDPSSHIADSSFTFYQVIRPLIAATCDTQLHLYGHQSCTLWINGTGSEPLSYLWLKDGIETDCQTDTMILRGTTQEQAGVYQCRLSNRWGSAISDCIRLTVEETFKPDLIKDSLHLSVSEDSLLDVDLRDSCVSEYSRELAFYAISSTLGGDSLHLSGRFTFPASYADSGHYQVSAFVTDGTTRDTFIIAIAVKNVNRAPVISSHAPSATTEDSVYTYQPQATDPDGDELGWTLMGAPAGMTVDTLTGLILWTPTEGITTSDTFSLTATDDGTPPRSHVETIIIAVTAVNDPPVISGLEGQAIEEDRAFSDIRLDECVHDPDNEDGQLAWTFTGNKHVHISINDHIASIEPEKEWSGKDTITFFVADPLNAKDSCTVVFAIGPANDPPSVSVLSELSVPEGGDGVITASMFSVIDPDNDPDELTFSVLTRPANGHLSHDSLTLPQLQSGVLTYTHNGTETAGDRFTFRVSDLKASAPAQTFTISVSKVNDPPLLIANEPLAVMEGAAVVIDSSHLFVSDEEQGAASLVYTVINSTTNGLLHNGSAPLSSSSTFTQASVNGGSLRYTHDGGETHSDQFTFSVSDGAGGEASATFSVAVTGVNDAPEFGTVSGDMPSSLPIGQNLEQTVSASDAEGTPLSYSVVNGPPGMIISQSSGEIQWYADPVVLDPGENYMVRICVSDGMERDTLSWSLSTTTHRWTEVYDYSALSGTVLFAAQDDQVVYYVTSDQPTRIYRSTDGGGTYTLWATSPERIQRMEATPTRLVLATMNDGGGGPSIVELDAATAGVLTSGITIDGEALHDFDVDEDNRIALVYDKMVPMSNMNEIFIYDHSDGSADRWVSERGYWHDVRVSPTTILATMLDSLFIKRSDGSWAILDVDPGVRASPYYLDVQCDNTTGDTVYLWRQDQMSTGFDLIRSVNGNSATLSYDGFDKVMCDVIPGIPERFVMMTGQAGWVLTDSELLFTNDGHATYHTDALPVGADVSALTDILVAADGKTAYCFGGGKLYRY